MQDQQANRRELPLVPAPWKLMENVDYVGCSRCQAPIHRSRSIVIAVFDAFPPSIEPRYCHPECLVEALADLVGDVEEALEVTDPG